MFVRLLVILVAAASSHRADGSDDIFSSTAHLSQLLFSNDITDAVRRYISQEQRKIAILQTKLALLEKMRTAKYTGVTYSEHPVGVYHLMRAYYDINLTVHDRKPFDDFVRVTSDTIPDPNDLLGASLGIVRLHKTYKLSAYDLIRGTIGNMTTSFLGVQEAYHIAKTAYDNKFFDEALSWMNAVYDTYHHSISGEFRKSVLMHLAYCYEMIPDVYYLRKTVQLLHTFYPQDLEIQAYHGRVDARLSHAIGTVVKTELSDVQRYEALCRGDCFDERKGLADNDAICRYRPVRAPYDRVKEEVLSLSPHVLFYYDVITDGENAIIKTMTMQNLKTSRIGTIASKAKTSKIRVSKTAWLWDDHSKDKTRFVAGISRRIGQITGLSTSQRITNSDCEATQIVNYGIGGQYESHMDTAPGVNNSEETIPQPIRGSGDRIATFLVYLSNVAMGGATVFPRAGLKVDAVKNGAVFWYNVQPSGAYDWLTLHAGCPVLLGEKWIANKWFREKGQMFRRPCGLQPDTPHENLHLPHDHRFKTK